MTRRYYAREAVVRYVTRKDVQQPPALKHPADAVAFLRPLIAPELVEVAAVLTLDTKHRVIAYHEIGRGTLDGTTMHPRDVLRAAIMDNAAAIVVAHNHPSGDPAPSPDDLQLARRLKEAGELIGIVVLDFLIVTDDRHWSYQETH